MRSLRRRHTRLILSTAALLLFFFLALNSLSDDSPTMDEQNHIARGLAFLRTGDPRLSLEHPPLINALSALPLLTMPELRLPTDHPSWERREGWYEFADIFLWQYNDDVGRIVFLSRLPIVFLTIGLALVGYRFAAALWGGEAGLMALALLLFEPNLLAHGRYSTTDVGGTLFTFMATFMLWRLWQSPGRWARRWLWAALAMGLAFGSKLSALGFGVVWGVLALLPLYPTGGRRAAGATARRLGQLAAAWAAALLVVWVIFGFQWGAFQFVSPELVALNGWRGPMPTFWAGVEQIARLGGGGRSQAFLLGHFSDDGFLAYFPVAFAVKTPLVLLAALALAAWLLLGQRATRRPAIFLLAAAGLFYALTMASALNIGYRHVLPALPYLLVLIAGLGGRALAGRRLVARWSGVTSARLGAATVALLLAVALWTHPHYLSYFNLIAGGPANGYRVLIDSNVDWGQDLLRLQAWMAENDVPEVRLGWFGSADPQYYGLAHQALPGIGRDRFFRLWWEPPFDPAQPEPGIYAISATSLWETPLRPEEKRIYAWFRGRQPDARVGHSILIYNVESDDR